MGDGPKLDDGRDERLEGSSGTAKPVPSPPRARLPKIAPPPTIGPAKVGPPKAGPPKVGPPKVGPPKVGPPKVGPPKVGPPKVAAPKVGPPKVAAPKLAQPKVGSVPAPPKVTLPSPGSAATPAAPIEPVSTLGDLRLPPAGSSKSGAPMLAPPPTVSPRSTGALPPPPEFRPNTHSSHAPLENDVRDFSGMIDTRPLVPVPISTPAETSDLIDLADLRLPTGPHAPYRPDASEDEDEFTVDDPDEPPVDSDEPPVDDPDDSPVDFGEPPADDLDQTRPSTGPSESMDLDIEISDDAIPRLDVELPSRERLPLPRLASQTPTMPAPTVDAIAAAPSRPRTAEPFADVMPPPRGTPLVPWIAGGVAVVLSLAAIMWLAGGTDESDADAKPAAVAPEPPTSPPRPPEPAPTPTPTPTPTQTQPPSADPTPPPDAADPTPPFEAAEPPEPSPPDADASIITVKPDTSDYERAAADYEATQSQDALLGMARAACALHDGPRARAAFRKLLGRELRSQAMVECRTHGVDVTSKVAGHTGPELLVQARAALEAGDAKTAFDKAHASNKVERSSDAVEVQALAACTMGDVDKARRLLPHVSKKARPTLIEDCRAVGAELEGK
ncbi:hypothetical protein [Paraliomyxa miuraensis]|uniref:hypothetical protein n=1 Tax=Paraliomyxa miuraensis TaxID=376150 RepID=UPI00225BFB3D|nr:hypothetical protein [Paraliomyxa miuraensis]MCX4245970.1 hypothetical protein [Paraliomyxa miuraensis]